MPHATGAAPEPSASTTAELPEEQTFDAAPAREGPTAIPATALAEEPSISTHRDLSNLSLSELEQRVASDSTDSDARSEVAMGHLKQAVSIFAEIGAEAGGWQPEIWKLVEW